jgi:uncharacterized protein
LKRFLLAVLTAVLLNTGMVWAGPFEDGIVAHERGDFATALGILQPLATQGNSLAQLKLAMMYRRGHGVTRDDIEALKWYRLAGIQGNISAQVNLALMHGRGQGTTKDYAESLKWFRLAADQGDSSAQFNIGTMYDKGQGTTQDYAEAVKWYRLAALQRDYQAQYSLAVMYSSGLGVSRDYLRAHMWFNLSASANEDGAAQGRDAVAKLMTPQQVIQAQKMASNCLKSNYKDCQ